MQELIHKRAARSKTFELDDTDRQTWLAEHPDHEGPLPTHRLEVGGGHAHHQKDGAWVETDTNWTDLTDRFGIGDHPFDIHFNKTTRTLSIDFMNGDVITLTPLNMRAPLGISRVGHSVTITRLWTGIDLELLLAPEGLHFHYTKTSTTFVNPGYTYTGPLEKYHGACYYTDPNATISLPTAVPHTIDATTLVYDFSGVPVGVVVE
jgi:hypothetical protein